MQDIRAIIIRHRRFQIKPIQRRAMAHRDKLDIIDIVLVALVGRVIEGDIDRCPTFGARAGRNGLSNVNGSLGSSVGGVFVAEELGDLLHLALVGVLDRARWRRDTGRLRRRIHGFNNRGIIGGSWTWGSRQCAASGGIPFEL